MKNITLYLLLGISSFAVTISAAEDENSEYVFFVGANVQIEYKSDYYEVVGVDGKSLTINVKSKRTNILRKKIRMLDVEREAKISSQQAHVDRFESKRVFSKEVDPELEWMSQSITLQHLQGERVDAAQRSVVSAAVNNSLNPNASTGPAVQTAMANYDQVSGDTQNIGGMASDRSSVGNSSAEPDALQITFELSSSEQIEKPYVLALASYTDPTLGGLSRTVTMFKHLKELGPDPQQVALYRSGLPINFALDSVTVHVFANGEEIGTNVSEKRVSLSRSDALVYLIFQHKSENSGETIPPAAVWKIFPSDAREYLDAKLLRQKIRIEVSDGGEPTNVTGSNLDMDIQYQIMNAAFYPALRNGEPVEGTLTIELRELVQ